jgi:D-alanine transaminase
MIFLNGKYLSKDDAKISVMDRGFLFGDGVYEVIPVYQKKIFSLEEHLKRLHANLEELDITNPYDNSEWENIFTEIIKHSPFEQEAIYLQVTRGVMNTRAHYQENLNPTVFVESNKISNRDNNEIFAGYSAITEKDERWYKCHIKSISLLANVFSIKNAKKNNVEEVIFIRDGVITEGASSNVFIVKNNQVFTHPKNNLILPGITREISIRILQDLNIEVFENSFTEEEMMSADEIWITSSTREILPITSVNSKKIQSGKAGPLWEKVYLSYQSIKNG